MNFPKALYALLADETDAEDRIYPVFTPQRNATYPLFIYQQVSGSSLQTNNGGSTTQEALVQLTAIGTTPLQPLDLLNAARVLLHGYSGTAGGIVVQHILIEPGSIRDIPYLSDDTEQLERYAKSMDLRVMYEDTVPTN